MKTMGNQQKKQKPGQRIFLFLLFTLAFCLCLLPGKAFAEPEFETVSVSNADELAAAMCKTGNVQINLAAGFQKEIYSYKTPYITVGKGIKVLDLNGKKAEFNYNSTLDPVLATNNYYMTDGYCTLFQVENGAELVINDSVGKGMISYTQNDFEVFDNKGEDTHSSKRFLIYVDGGKLTVNGGELSAGNSDKFWLAEFFGDNGYYWRQIAGTAIYIHNGEAVLNGGVFRGRKGRNAAINLSKDTKMTVYDGEFWGMGGADVFDVSEGADLKIYGGVFNTHKMDYPEYYSEHSKGKITYGEIGIPIRAFDASLTQVKVDGTGVLSDKQMKQELTKNTHKRVTVTPKRYQKGTMLHYDEEQGAYGVVPYGMVYEWDKTSPLIFRFQHNYYYPLYKLHDYDVIKKYHYGDLVASFQLIPESTFGICYAKEYDGDEFIDLCSLKAEDLAQLKVGNTYYVRIADSEEWNNGTGDHEVFYRDGSVVKVKIVAPDYTMPELNIGFDWENELDTNYENQLVLTPTGDGTKKKLDAMIHKGLISRYVTVFQYKKKDGQLTTITKENGADAVQLKDVWRGTQSIRYNVTLFKGTKRMGSVDYESQVVCFPDITADIPADSSHRVLVSASAEDKKVILSCDSYDLNGLFWVKDSQKLSSDTGAKSHRVDLSEASNIGWYSIGYTLNGQDYYSDQMLALNIKEGSRNISLNTSSDLWTIKENGQEGPILTAELSGTGWGPVEYYKWQNVSWPSGTNPTARMKKTDTNTMSVATLFAFDNNHLTERFLEGKYTFAVTAVDNYGKSATATVSLTVKRPATGLKLYTDDYGLEYHTPMDLTDSFLMMEGEDSSKLMEVYGVFTPENAVPGTLSYQSETPSIVSVDSQGVLRSGKSGNTYITVSSGKLSAKTQVIVPKTKYEISIPEEWLNPVPGGTVHHAKLDYKDFTVELLWNIIRNGTDYDYDRETFESNAEYRPVLRIRPKAGVAYPVNISEVFNRVDYDVDKSRMEFVINGLSYYGASYCGRDTFFDSAPVSGEDSDDFIDCDLDPTGVLIDPCDEYLDQVVFGFEEPMAGDPKDMNQELSALLNYRIQTDGVNFGGDYVEHITDLTTIEDDDIANDKREDFTTYEEGETYRYQIYLIADNKYRNSQGGKVFMESTAEVLDPEHDTLTDRTYVNNDMLVGYVYFTCQKKTSIEQSGSAEEEKGKISQDGTILTDEDGDPYYIAEKLTPDKLIVNAMIVDKASGGKYKITKVVKKGGKVTGGTVTYMKPYDKNCKKIAATDKVKLAGVTFTVTAIAPNCAKGCEQLTKLILGKNIKSIGKNAFNGCKKLKSITIKTAKLTKKSVGANAFKGIHAKAKVKVPKKQLQAYKKLLKKSGIKGKKQKITK